LVKISWSFIKAPAYPERRKEADIDHGRLAYEGRRCGIEGCSIVENGL